LLRTVDISAGGALFRSERCPPVGMVVSIVLFLRSDPRESRRYVRIVFQGTVVRTEPGRFAVAFTETGQAAGLQRLSEPEAPAPVISRIISMRPDREGT
jgi:hypothetical protein